MYLLCSYFTAKYTAYCTCLLLLRWDTGKVRDKFGGMGRLRCKGWANSVTINVISEINDRCNYIHFLYVFHSSTM